MRDRRHSRPTQPTRDGRHSQRQGVKTEVPCPVRSGGDPNRFSNPVYAEFAHEHPPPCPLAVGIPLQFIFSLNMSQAPMFFEPLSRCDEGVPRTGEKIRWKKQRFLFLAFTNRRLPAGAAPDNREDSPLWENARVGAGAAK
jgi:hypothetical protein